MRVLCLLMCMAKILCTPFSEVEDGSLVSAGKQIITADAPYILCQSLPSPYKKYFDTTALQLSIMTNEIDFIKACIEGQLPLVKSVVDSATGPELKKKLLQKRDEDERTGLHWACSGNRIDVADYLLRQGADVNSQDEANWTPLHIASSAGHEDIVRLLVEFKADVNCQTENGQTPLHYAASKNHLEIGEYLLRNGANPNLADKAKQLPLHRAAAKGNLKFAELLVTNKSKVNSQDRIGNTPLHLACEEGNGPLALYLIETCNADQDAVNREGKTPEEMGSESFRKWFQRQL